MAANDALLHNVQSIVELTFGAVSATDRFGD